MTTFPIEIVHGHIIAITSTGRWVIDTGSPASFGDRLPGFRPNESALNTSLMGLTAKSLSESIGDDLAGLIGGDLLGPDDLLIDIPKLSIAIGESFDFVPSSTLPVTWVMGVPMVDIEVDGEPAAVFFDTGAPISYLQGLSDADYPGDEPLDDCYPGVGAFTTWHVPLRFAGREQTVRCGELPGLLGMTLLMAGSHGIIGPQLISDRRVVLSYHRDELLVR